MVCRHGLGPYWLLMLLLDAISCAGSDGKDFEWPNDSIGERTTERVAAAKRAGKYIACQVCEQVVLSKLPRPHDQEQISKFMGGEEFSEQMDDVKSTCNMKRLAKTFKFSKLEVVTQPDGTAVMRSSASKSEPFYEEINRSELAFHWKSFAVEHACQETFRRGAAVSSSLRKAFDRLAGEQSREEEVGEQELKERVRSAVKASCQRAKFCKASVKLWSERSKSSVAGRAAEL
eukprot:TRINITY_DN49952_c0_g1_i1.p1 TRINITY_DN49952_c0_g1~~TRINITY_DN49952_c0_g1_i1.p1  ORF type:complete len:232 (-),score=64.17 TRINITY_DN49952_c0_g1_i1:58-753(-)